MGNQTGISRHICFLPFFLFSVSSLPLEVPLHSTHYKLQHFFCPRKSLFLRLCIVYLFTAYHKLPLNYCSPMRLVKMLSPWFRVLWFGTVGQRRDEGRGASLEPLLFPFLCFIWDFLYIEFCDVNASL